MITQLFKWWRLKHLDMQWLDKGETKEIMLKSSVCFYCSHVKQIKRMKLRLFGFWYNTYNSLIQNKCVICFFVSISVCLPFSVFDFLLCICSLGKMLWTCLVSAHAHVYYTHTYIYFFYVKMLLSVFPFIHVPFFRDAFLNTSLFMMHTTLSV